MHHSFSSALAAVTYRALAGEDQHIPQRVAPRSAPDNPAKPGTSSRSFSLRGGSKKTGCWGPEMRSFSPANCLHFVLSAKGMRNVVTAAVTTPLFCCTQDRLDTVYMVLLVVETLTFFLNDL